MKAETAAADAAVRPQLGEGVADKPAAADGKKPAGEPTTASAKKSADAKRIEELIAGTANPEQLARK